MSNDGPQCGNCNCVMTLENSQLRPELFLCDKCLPITVGNYKLSTPRPTRGAETPTIRYCLGFLFNAKRNYVLLIEKKRPEWQRCKLNGIGGKLENGESSFDAMHRECFEETGLNFLDWQEVCIMGTSKWKCQVFAALSDKIWEVQQKEDEELYKISVKGLLSICLPNVHWLVPMCLDNEICEQKYAIRSMTKIFESEY